MTQRPENFRELATAVGDSGVFRLTPRDLLGMVGAQRRGIHVVGEIRSRLARHFLATEPDFAEVNADQTIEVVRTRGHRPAYVDILEGAVERLRNDPQNPLRVTPRTMLGWFGAERRGSSIMESVHATLAGFELETNPDFRSVHLDQEVELVGRDRVQPPDSEADDPSEAAEPEQPIAEQEPDIPATPSPAPVSASPVLANNTFHIGTLPEATREVIGVKPQSSLRVALSTMISRKVSYLPIMKNERAVTGVLRWKDVGRYLLLNGDGSLDDPVERAQNPPIEVRYSRPFLDVIPDIIKHGYVLVRGPKNTIAGIVTKKDLGRQLLDRASPFVLLGEIERGLRALSEPADFLPQELRDLALDPKSPRDISDVEDLTLGELQRLLDNPEAWPRVKINIDKATFISELSKVRNVRNTVMHFHPDGTNEDDRRQLSHFLELIYDLQRFAKR